MSCRNKLLLLVACAVAPLLAHADLTQLIDAPTIQSLAEETSGVAAKRHLDASELLDVHFRHPNGISV